METHLLDVKLASNIWAMDMFVPTPPTRKDLHIIHVGSTRFEPIDVVLAKKGSMAYVVNVKDAVKSSKLMGSISADDQATINNLAKLNPPKPDYSKWVFKAD